MKIDHDESAGLVTLRTEANGAPVTIEVHGEGAPILLVGAATSRVWTAPLVGALREDHAVIDFDYERPEGWDAPSAGRTCVQLAADAVAVMDAIGLPRAHVVGISRGAVSAYAMATRHADRVLSVSLLTPVAPYPDHLDRPSPTHRDIQDEDELLAYVGDLLFTRAYQQAQPETVRAVVFDPAGSVVRVLRGEEETLLRSEVPEQPTQIVVATDDEVVPLDDPQAIREVATHARWTELPGRHGAHHEDPQVWADAIRSFVA